MSVDFDFIDILMKNYWIENRSFYIMSEGIIGKCQISDVPTRERIQRVLIRLQGCAALTESLCCVLEQDTLSSA